MFTHFFFMPPSPPKKSNVGKTTVDLIQILNNYQHCVWGRGSSVQNHSKCQFVYKFFPMSVYAKRDAFVWFPHCELFFYVKQYSISTSLWCLCISQLIAMPVAVQIIMTFFLTSQGPGDKT